MDRPADVADSPTEPPPVPGGLVGRVVTLLTAPPLLPIAAAMHGLLLAAVVLGYLGTLPPTPVAPGTGDLVTGDFVVFYVAGRTVWEGEGHLLFDHRDHVERTRRLTGPAYEDELWYVNPPGFAIALAPVSALPWRAAFYLRGAILVFLACWTVVLLRPVLPTLWARSAWLTVLLMFSFHPVLRTLIGGQNTSLTLFLLAGVTWGLLRNDPPGSTRWGSWTAGLFLGLLSYKPQFGLLPGLVLLARRDVRALGLAVVVSLLHYAVGAIVCGPAWPLDLLRELAEFQRYEPLTNAHSHLSLLSVSKSLLPAGVAKALTGAVTIGCCGYLALACARAGDDPGRLKRSWALAVALGLLLSPHTQYYDVGLIVLPVVLLLDEQLHRSVTPSVLLRLLLLVGFLGYPLYGLVERWPIPQPLVLWPIVVAVWALRSGPSLIEARSDGVTASQ